jgi:hemoglobin
MKSLISPILTLFTATILVFSGCKKDEIEPVIPQAPNAPESLYTRLGGVDAITAVTDKFLANVAADNTINAQFAETVANPSRLQLLRLNLIDQICAGSGGPCIYKGKSMLEAHQGMNITDAQFNALVGDLVASLDFYSVPTKEKDDLLAILGPMSSDIVGQ